MSVEKRSGMNCWSLFFGDLVIQWNFTKFVCDKRIILKVNKYCHNCAQYWANSYILPMMVIITSSGYSKACWNWKNKLFILYIWHFLRYDKCSNQFCGYQTLAKKSRCYRKILRILVRENSEYINLVGLKQMGITRTFLPPFFL